MTIFSRCREAGSAAERLGEGGPGALAEAEGERLALLGEVPEKHRSRGGIPGAHDRFVLDDEGNVVKLGQEFLFEREQGGKVLRDFSAGGEAGLVEKEECRGI